MPNTLSASPSPSLNRSSAPWAHSSSQPEISSAPFRSEAISSNGHGSKTHENTPLLLPSDRIIVSWDTAMNARELSDYSACVVLLVRNGTAFVLDVVRERLEYPR